MKRNYLILAVLIIASVCLLSAGYQAPALAAKGHGHKHESTAAESPNSPSETEAAPDNNEPGPIIEFENLVHDFGRIDPGSENVCEFKFKNVGDDVLKIKKVNKTCGCTPFTLEKKEYAPGETGTLKVKYNASKRAGSVKRRLTVLSNDKASPKVTLTVKGTLVKKIKYEPKKLNLLLSMENAGCLDIKLSTTDNKPFSIERFKSTGNCITADVNSSVEAKSFTLKPKVDIEKLKDNLNGRIEITLTPAKYDSVTIPFSSLPLFSFDPPSIVILNADPQKPRSKEVWLLSNYDNDFEVESVSSRRGIIKVSSQRKVDNRYEFELQITPPPAENKVRFFSDVFIVNIKGGGKLEINCRGFYSKKK